MKRKRASQGSAPAKKMAGAFRQPAVVAQPQRSLRFQPNTIHGRNPEKKEITLANTNEALVFGSLAWVVPAANNLLNGVVQGTTAETRLGRKIRMRSLDFRWSAFLGPTSTGGSPVRILIFYDKQANAALPLIASLMQANDFHAPMNLANSDRFTILRSVITEPISQNNNFSVSGHEYVVMDLETIYNDVNGGLITDIVTGSVFVVVSHNGQILTANGGFTFISRIRFDDN